MLYLDIPMAAQYLGGPLVKVDDPDGVRVFGVSRTMP